MFGGESFCHISILQLNMMTSRDSDCVSVDGDVKYMEAMLTVIFIYSSFLLDQEDYNILHLTLVTSARIRAHSRFTVSSSVSQQPEPELCSAPSIHLISLKLYSS